MRMFLSLVFMLKSTAQIVLMLLRMSRMLDLHRMLSHLRRMLHMLLHLLIMLVSQRLPNLPLMLLLIFMNSLQQRLLRLSRLVIVLVLLRSVHLRRQARRRVSGGNMLFLAGMVLTLLLRALVGV